MTDLNSRNGLLIEIGTLRFLSSGIEFEPKIQIFSNAFFLI